MGAGGEVGKTKGDLSRARKVNFSKRKDCIMKKTRELSVLCGVKACAIVFRPEDGRVETWPENLNEVQQVINAYKDYSFKKENGSVSADGDAKKRKVGDNYTGYADFIGVEKKQKLSSETEMEFLGDELKKIDSTLEKVRNRIQILKQQKEGQRHGYGCGCGCGYGYGYASSSSPKHYYQDFAAVREGLLQIEDFDNLDHIFTLNELNMIQESSDKGWVQWDMNTQEYDQHSGANQYGYFCG